MNPVKAQWSQNVRAYRSKGIVALEISVGAVNYHDGAEWQEIDLTPEVSDDQAFDWMIVKTQHKSYWRNNGDRRIFPSRNDPSKYLDIATPAFITGDGKQTNNRMEWTGDKFDTLIEWKENKIVFDVTLKEHPGFSSMSFPFAAKGMTDRDVGKLLNLKAYQETDRSRNAPLDWAIVGADIVVSWDSVDLSAMAYPIVIDPTIDLQISAGADDVAHGGSDHNVYPALGDLYVGEVSGITGFSTTLRFPSVTIPQGNTIDAAYVSLRAKFTNASLVHSTAIAAHDADSSSQIASDANYHSIVDSNLTTASVSWSPPDQTADAWENTPSLITVIQEVVDRPGWASGSDIHIVIEYAAGAATWSRWYSYDAAPASAPKLHVEHSAAAPPTAISGTMSTVSALSGAVVDAFTGVVGTLASTSVLSGVVAVLAGLVGSRARTIMTMRAYVERNGTATTDTYGHPGAPAFAAQATIPCRVYSKKRWEQNDDKKTALIENIRCSMPLYADVTELDQIANITNRRGIILWAGPLRIDAIQRKHTHIEMDLKRIQS